MSIIINPYSFVASNGLLANLTAYWKMDEASGNAIDAHGSNDLTINGALGSTAGKVNNCRTFGGSGVYFSLADNADMSVGDEDFTFAGWVYISDKTATRSIFSKFRGSAGARSYGCDYLSSSDRFRFYVSPDGSAATTVTADNFGSPSTLTWYFIVCWHDSSANTINIQINGGTADSAAHSTGVFDSTTDFELGRRNTDNNPLVGRLDEWGFWKRTLTATEKTFLYNSGAGRTYSDFS